ncbi:hypothetical protein RJE46_10680 [Cedecea neteri]|nr:hypothetical protein [Cedecea neteri]WNJ81662.1 hypothetical protein RJE46_10680 [Cedecea neteri]
MAECIALLIQQGNARLNGLIKSISAKRFGKYEAGFRLIRARASGF